MGIKHFFGWFKTNFGKHIHNLSKGKKVNAPVDVLMIDLNGLFHSSTQKIYEYGNHKPLKSLMPRNRKYKRDNTKQIQVFVDICNNIKKITNVVKPQKKLVLCVDGPAPIGKQCQQRQRRFRSAKEKSNDEFRKFDSNCLTPGTKFMDFLTKYIDWFIRKQMSTDKTWQEFDVIFSNEKVAGEGEHKCVKFIRDHGSVEDIYCIHGLDADLIMLSLGTHMPNFYVLRDDIYNHDNEFFFINIGNVRKDLSEMMRWSDKEYKFVPELAINDFIFLCFLVGNDFLPHMPSLEIIEGGIDAMIDVYKQICEHYGHLTKLKKDVPTFRKKPVKIFFGTMAQYEKGMLEGKLKKKGVFFPDPVLESNAVLEEDGNYELNIEQYRSDYYTENFPQNTTIKKICHHYLEGMQWVLSYYTRGVQSWTWFYPYHYAPFAFDMKKYIKSFKFSKYSLTTPTSPYLQLISVLPPRSFRLIPKPLSSLLVDKMSPLKKFCPHNFDVDISGKRRKWEGIVLLPFIDHELFEQEYFNLLQYVENRDKKRNRLGKNFIYKYNKYRESLFQSYYGNFNSNVTTEVIEF